MTVAIPQEAATTASLEVPLDRKKLRQVRRREDRYLLRTNVTAHEAAALWSLYIQLAEVEQAFKEIKNGVAVRPIFHRNEERIGARIFVASLACCLQATLKAKLRALAGGTTPREVIEEFETMQMVDELLPTDDGRELTLSRHTQPEPEPEHKMLLDQLRLAPPTQPPPRITSTLAKLKAVAFAL